MALYAHIHTPHFPIYLLNGIKRKIHSARKKQDESCLALRAFLLPLLRPLISYDTKTI